MPSRSIATEPLRHAGPIAGGEKAQAAAGTLNNTPHLWPVWAVALIGLLLSLRLHWRLRGMAFDDTYIHLRIARNLLRTGHAWFNLDERVMATSSPLWTLLIALLHLPGQPSALPVLEAVLLWASAVLAFRVAFASLPLAPRATRSAFASVACVSTVVLLLPSSVGQMETPLAIALLLAAWLCTLRQRSAALPLLALAACTRLELLPVLFLAAVASLLLQRGRALLGVMASVAIVGAAAGWTYAQFGVLLPNSIRAKQITYSFNLAQAAHQFLASRLRDEFFLVLLLGLLAVTAGRARLYPEKRQRTPGYLALAASVTALLLAGNYIIHHTVIFDWYRPLVYVPLALGLLLSAALSKASGAVRWTLAAVTGACLVFFLAEPVLQAGHMLRAGIHPDPATESMVDGGDSSRVQGYLELGTLLKQLCPQSRLLTPEIGALGWAFDGYIYDSVGIASPAALRYQPLDRHFPRGGTPAAYVLAVQPDVIVAYRVLDWSPHDTPGVIARYDLMELAPSPRNLRGGLLDRGWRSSTSLDVWSAKGGNCPRGTLEAPLRKMWQ